MQKCDRVTKTNTLRIQMGLFDAFKKKPAYNGTIEDLVRGYLVTETSKLMGEPVHTAKFKELQEKASIAIKETMIHGLHKKTQQEVFDTLSSACPKDPNGAFGQYLILVFVRFGVIQQAIVAGQVTPEEATLDIVCNALHTQIKKFISSI